MSEDVQHTGEKMDSAEENAAYPVSSSPCLDPVTNSTSSLLEFFNLLSGAWDFLTVVLLVKTEAKKTLTTLSFSLSDVQVTCLMH